MRRSQTRPRKGTCNHPSDNSRTHEVSTTYTLCVAALTKKVRETQARTRGGSAKASIQADRPQISHVTAATPRYRSAILTQDEWGDTMIKAKGAHVSQPSRAAITRSAWLTGACTALALVAGMALGGPPASAADTIAVERAAYRDCGYGKRGLQITAVQARSVTCTVAWDVVAGGMKNVIARWDNGWFQELLVSGRSRSFTYEGWRCTVRAVHREGYSLTCTSGSARIRSGTGA